MALIFSRDATKGLRSMPARERGQMLVDRVEHMGTANGSVADAREAIGATAVGDGGSAAGTASKEGQHAEEPISEGAGAAGQVR